MREVKVYGSLTELGMQILERMDVHGEPRKWKDLFPYLRQRSASLTIRISNLLIRT